MTNPTLEHARPAIVDAHSVFVTGEDNLRVTAFNSLAGVELALEGRFVNLDGRVIPIAERIVPTSDRVASVSLHSIGEGYLANLMIRAGVGSPQRGQTFVVVELVRGRLGAIQPLGCLLQGYVSSAQRLAWPGSPIESGVGGAGVLRSVTGANPAAGAEVSETVPAGVQWLLHAVTVALVTSASVANRTPLLIIDDGAVNLMTLDPSGTIPASQAWTFSWHERGYATAVNGVSMNSSGPFPLRLGPGFRIRTLTGSIQVGDNYGAPQLLVEEWLG